MGRKGDHLAIREFLFVDHAQLDMRSMQSVMSSEIFLNRCGEEADALRLELSQVDLDTTGNLRCFKSVYSTVMFAGLISILV